MKIALCIGLNYSNTPNELSGCIPDVKRMSNFLSDKGFVVVKLTDELKPVKSLDIISHIEDLINTVNNNTANSKVVIHYSGHGSNIPDISGDEKDGRDEVICSSNGFISDDTLYKYLERFKEGTRVFCVFDCCHSGTILDLKYRNNVIENRRCSIKIDICAISGCKDNETSADITYSETESGGLLTTTFLETFRGDFEIMYFVNLLRWKTKNYGQCPEYTHSYKEIYDLGHFF